MPLTSAFRPRVRRGSRCRACRRPNWIQHFLSIAGVTIRSKGVQFAPDPAGSARRGCEKLRPGACLRGNVNVHLCAVCRAICAMPPLVSGQSSRGVGNYVRPERPGEGGHLSPRLRRGGAADRDRPVRSLLRARLRRWHRRQCRGHPRRGSSQNGPGGQRGSRRNGRHGCHGRPLATVVKRQWGNCNGRKTPVEP